MASTPDDIGSDLAYLFNQASHALGSVMTARLAELGITAREHCVLSKAMAGELTQGEIAEQSLLDKTTMVVTLDRLEKAGLAQRRPSAADRRARIVVTTPAGARLVQQTLDVVAGIYAELLEHLPAQQRAAFVDSLVRLVDDGGPLSPEVATHHPPRRRAARASRVVPDDLIRK